MHKDKFLILTIIILFVLNLFTLGYVMFGGHNMIPPHEEQMRDMRDENRPPVDVIQMLNLNEQQRKQFEDLKKEHRSQVEPLQDESRKLHDELFGLLKENNYDTGIKNVLLDQISSNQKKLDIATFEHFEKLRGILNDEQKKDFGRFLDHIAHSLKPMPPK